MARSNNKEYDCLLIYNHARSRLSRLEDHELSLRVVECTDERLRQWGYTKNHYYDRDNIPGRNVFTELFRVVGTSQFVLLFLTRGFLQNCWIRYCQMAAFKKLIDESIRPDQIASHRVIPILINITEDEVPQELGQLTYICFRDDWEKDGPEWQKLKRALDGQSLQETIPRGIGDVRPSATLNHMSQQLPESCSNQTVQNEISANPGSNLLHNSNIASHCNNPAAAAAPRNHPFQTIESTLTSRATSDPMDSFESSQLFSSGGRDLRTSSSLPNTSQTNNRFTPLNSSGQPPHQRESTALMTEEEDHVTLSGFGSLNNEWTNNQLGQRTGTPRLSEAAQPITHPSSVRSGSRDPDIQEDAPRISGILHLQSQDLEPDAQESIMQPSTAGPRTEPPSQIDSVSDSGIGLLNGPEGEPLNFNSLMEESTSSAFSSRSSEISNSAHINRDEPDTGVKQSPEGLVTEKRESRPSFLSQAFHFTLHALFHPDKVYHPL